MFIASSVSRGQKKKIPQDLDKLDEEVHGFTIHDGMDVLGIPKSNKIGEENERIEHEPIEDEKEVNTSMIVMLILFVLIVIWRVFFRDLIL